MILSDFCFPSFFVVLLEIYVWQFELICHEIQKNCNALYNINFKLILMTTIHWSWFKQSNFRFHKSSFFIISKNGWNGVFLYLCFFRVQFLQLQHHSHKHIFNILCTNLCPISFQFNLNSFQFNHYYKMLVQFTSSHSQNQ